MPMRSFSMTPKRFVLPLVVSSLLWPAADTQRLSARSLVNPRGADTSVPNATPPALEPPLKSHWGMDILFSTNGFGLGVFYRKEFSQDIAGVVSLSVSESKDERDMERVDPFTQATYTPGKLNRFLVLPLTMGIQY